jgi:hypothetical protein
MNRKRFPMNFAARPVRAALAVKMAIAILSLNVSVAAAKVYLSSAKPAPVIAESVSSVTPFILPLDVSIGSEKASCREADEGYGVRGEVCGG